MSSVTEGTLILGIKLKFSKSDFSDNKLRKLFARTANSLFSLNFVTSISDSSDILSSENVADDSIILINSSVEVGFSPSKEFSSPSAFTVS